MSIRECLHLFSRALAERGFSGDVCVLLEGPEWGALTAELRADPSLGAYVLETDCGRVTVARKGRNNR